MEMLIREHRLSPEFAHKLRLWHHSGFQVWVGRPVPPEDQKSLDRLCAYILRPSFASTRLHYDSKQGQIEYETKKGIHRTMGALDWIALVTSHIPDPFEQTVRYYGRYSNASRGKRRKQATGITQKHRVDSAFEADSQVKHISRKRRINWARMIQKIYEVDPLACPRCEGPMEIIAFIEHPAAIRKILQHLKLRDRPQRSPPRRLLPHKLEKFLKTLSPRKAQQVKASTDSLFWEDAPLFEV
ncbi:MAG: transposase [Deltaproteobacteria bacterium]|nr:transposase [Deltaproteobacteria bacterium]